MNAVKKISASDIVHEIKESKGNISLVGNGTPAEQKEVGKMTKEYLNEKLYYFYTDGGPIMDI